jgi:hypothetical protein
MTAETWPLDFYILDSFTNIYLARGVGIVVVWLS